MSGVVLAMVPGAYFKTGDFVAHGFLDALRRRGWDGTAMEADLSSEAYLDRDVAERLHAIVRPVAGARLWLLGISLGALGALLYAQSGLAAVEGIVLLAPYLGSRGLVAEVSAAGGLAAWEPGAIGAIDFERRMMAGLKVGLPPRLHLGYGTADRFAPASRLLAAELPPERVVVNDGGHDWTSWQRLWAGVLDRGLFSA